MKDNSLISPGYAESRKFGIGPDFAIYTGTPKTAGIITIPEADAKRPIVQMCGSSTVMDLQGDIMALTALQDMTTLDPDFLIFTDHSYNLDNIFGKLYGQPVIQMQNTIADLWLAAEAALDHPPAERAYNLIVKSKLRLGCSIGCMVLDYEFVDEDDFFSPVIIRHVKCMEFSLVGIPANQRCWVENAIKGIFARSLIEGNGDEALKLAPAFKGLYPRDYASVIEQITSAGLRKEMQHIPMRSTHPQKIMYDFTEAREGFILSDSKGVMKSLSREETADLLQNGASLHTTTKAVGGNTSLPLMDIGTEWTGSKAEKEIFAQAEDSDGKITVSKAKPGFLWYDPDNADKRGGYKMPLCYNSSGLKIVPLGARACANVLHGGRGGGKFGGDEPGMRAKVKTIYGRINSQFKPDPEWVVPWDKKEDSAESVLTFDHVTINGVTYAFDEENNTFLPWVSKEGVLDTQAGNDLIRQDLEEEGQVDEKDKAKGVKVSTDGTHEPFTGTHTHAHKAYGAQGNDDLHEHEHEHNGDADHGHSHADGKSAEPDAQKAGGGIHINDDGSHEKMSGSHTHSHPNYGAKADGSMHSHEHEHKNDADHHHAHSDGKSAGIQVDEDGNHQPFTGNHTHAHKAFGGPDDNNDGKHSHAHDHDGDSNHKHSHADQKAAGEPHSHDGVEHTHPHEEEPNAVILAYLAMYNDLGKKLGFPEHTLTTKCDLVANDGDAGIVRSVLAALDDCSDAAMELAQRTDGYVDQLMGMMGVADVNDGEALPGVPGYYSLQHSLKSIQHYLTTKEGREISAKNQQIIQSIHDACMAMHPDVCKGTVSGDGTAHQSEGISIEDARAEAANMGQGQPSEYMNTDSITALNNLAKSFESFNVKAVVEASVKKAVDAAISDARKNLELLNREQQILLDTVAKLKNMPLGNPTRLNRTVVQDERAATYEDILSVNQQQKGLSGPSQTLTEALEQTKVVEKSVYLNGQETETKYRHWPEGVGGPVGKGVRPALTNDQKTFMMPHEWGIYNIGGAVDVPLIDDPAEVAV